MVPGIGQMSDLVIQSGGRVPGNSGAKIVRGCGLGCLVVVLGVSLFLVLALQNIQSRLNGWAEKSSSEGVEFVYPSVSTEQAGEVVARFDRFRMALANDQPVESLTLSADDLNILISQHPDFSPLARKLKVDIVENLFVSKVSFKPDELPMRLPFISKAFAGKYINGTILIDLVIEHEMGGLFVRDLKLDKIDIAPEILERLGEQNFMTNLLDNAEVNDLIRKVELLQIDENLLRIVPKIKPETVSE